MPDKDFQIPESLKDALKGGLVVPFIGAGVSLAVKKKDEDGTKSEESLFPSWRGFVEKLAEALKDENKSNEADFVLSSVNIKKPKYLEAMQHAWEELGANRWYRIFEGNFDKSRDEAHEDALKLSELIWKLSNNLIITTNVDRVFQWTCPKPSDYRYLDVQNVEYARLQNENIPARPTVWHLHGHIDHKESVIFTLDQYRAFYEERNNEAKLQTLLNFLTNRTFLFIGFSLDDAYIRQQLEYIHRIYKGGADSFYILLRESEIEKANLPDYVTPIPFSDFGEPLENLVEELSNIANGYEGKKENKFKPDNPKDKKSQENERKKSFFNVPYYSKGKEFVGRAGHTEEIWNLLNQKNNSPVGQNISIKGFGGWGKTQLAVEYAHEYQDKYKNGVFWLVADENIDSQLLQIADKQEWINQTDKTVNQINVAKAKFLALSESLIIFDNVESYEDIKDYLPKADLQNHILITSRHKLTEFRQFNLELLNPNESRELLLKVSKRPIPAGNESEQLEKLLETLGGIPLAIELVGGYLYEHENVSFAKYHQFLDEYPLPRLEKEFPEGDFTHQDRSIIPALRISEKLIREKPLMVEILNVLAWSGNTSMGISLLQSLVEAEDEFELQNALGDAHKLRLLKKDVDAERYTIHRLLAKVIRHENPLEQNKDWHQKIIKNLESWFDERKVDFKYLAEFEVEIEHLREWQNHSFKFLLKQSVWLFALEAYPPFQRGNYQASLHFLEKASNLYVTENLNDQELLANIINDFGTIFNLLGDYEQSLGCLLQVLEIRLKLLGRKHPDTAMSLTTVGEVYGNLGDYDEALKYSFQALEIQKELLGESHSDIAFTLNNIGLAYNSLGNHNEALKYWLQALEIQKELLGESHPYTAVFLNNIGGAYDKLDNHSEALKYLLQAFEIRKELLGEKHPDTALSLNNIGTAYRQLGNHKESLRCTQQAFELQKELLGEKHPNTILLASNLVAAYLNLGKINDAGILAAKFLKNVPNNHPQRQFFEKFGKTYEKLVQRKKNRRH